MIYVMAEMENGQRTPYVKIGCVLSDDREEALRLMYKRVRALQPGNPRMVGIVAIAPGGRVEEKALHARFSSARVKRFTICEWVQVTDEVQAWIDTLEQVNVSIRRNGPRVKAPPKRKCWRCGSVRHTPHDCPDRPITVTVPPGSPKPKPQPPFAWRGKTRNWYGVGSAAYQRAASRASSGT